MAEAVFKENVPPHNTEAEMAALGALLLNFSVSLLDEVRQYVKPEDFYLSSHQLIFHAIIALSEKGSGVDIITLRSELEAAGNLDKVGGDSYVSSLTSHVPTATGNAGYYARLIQEASIRRKILNTARGLISDAYDNSLETREIIEKTEQGIFDISSNLNRGELKTTQDVIPVTVEMIVARSKSQERYTGIPSGFEALDKLTNGFQNSELIIVGARPSIGKTAFALSLATNMAVHQQIPCGYFTLEMSATSLMMRVLSSESRIPARKLSSGLFGGAAETNKLTEAAGRIYDSSLIIQDSPNISLLDLRSLARRMVVKNGVKIIFVDYIGLITPSDSKKPRHELVSEFSRSLKALARELDIPIVVLSQVGRQSEGKAPSLADLRESGALEQDADVVILLHRKRKVDAELGVETGEGPDDKTAEIILAKQRNGPTGVVKLAFIDRFARFENLSNREQ